MPRKVAAPSKDKAKAPPPQIDTAPAPYRRGEGWERHKERGPTMHITMDAGAYDWLWLILEAKLKLAQSTAQAALLPEYQDVVQRAYRAFQTASTEPWEEAPAKTGRRVVRRSKQ